jgi:hypothetical protein
VSIHKEIALEDGICAHLAAQGWLYEANAAARYDRASALFPEDLLAWVGATQPDAWAALQKAHGAAAGATLVQRLRAALDKQGTLDVLRQPSPRWQAPGLRHTAPPPASAASESPAPALLSVPDRHAPGKSLSRCRLPGPPPHRA